MSKGTIATLLFLGLIGYLSFTLILSGNDLKCEVCIVYNDIEVCEKIEGKPKDRQEMLQLAVSTACAGAANGRTESMECSMTPPKSVSCNL